MLKRLLGNWKWIVGIVAVFVAVQLLISFKVLTTYWATILQRACIMAIVSLGLNLIYGFNGQFSLGQWGFYAIGAYAAADITYRWKQGDMAGLALVVVVALLVSVNTLGFPLFVGLTLFGIAGPSLFPIVILILMETPEVGEKHIGLAGGIFFCVAEIGGFTGPLVMGILTDLTGTFLAGAVFLAGLSLMIFVMTLLLKESSEST